MRSWALVLGLVACAPAPDAPDTPADRDPYVPDPPVEREPFVPAPATLHRLTSHQLRATWEELLGVEVRAALPEDYVLHGFATVGGATQTLPPADLERLEAAAWTVAAQAVPDVAAANARAGCALDRPRWEDGAARADACVRAWLARFLPEAWRRPVPIDEVDALAALYAEVAGEADPALGLQAVLVAALSSPHLVFRVEVGVADPSVPGGRRLDPWELAARLAYALTDAPPDAALRAAADDGTLLDPEVLAEHAERLLATPRAADTLTRFFAELLQLDRLDRLEKDPVRFPEHTATLGPSMRRELELLFRHVVLDGDRPWSDLFLTDTVFVDRELAPIYGLIPPRDAHVRLTLDPEAGRGGLLGRAGVLAVQAHVSQTSPTYRGKLVRARLLCHDVPPPPPGVVASLDGVEGGGSLRDRLSRHATDPVCRSCHEALDPIGFALEGFDALGRARTDDDGFPLDLTGSLDGVDFEGAAQLGLAVARHPDLLGCLALNLYRHTLGRAEQDAELVAIDELTAAAETGGGRLRPLVVALVTHPAFRTAQPPTAPCTDDEAGQARACDAACGPGVEVCVDGTWTGCDAPPAPAEACDGVDQDCDGVADAVALVCDGGLAVCVDGEPGACELPPAPAPACDGDHVTTAADPACDDPGSAACAAVLDAACAPCGAPRAGVVDVDGAWLRVACAPEAP